MTDDFEDRIGLAEFLTDLRAELSQAQARAKGDALKLGVEEIELTLEVAYTLSKSREAEGRVGAKFWVFASAEAAAKGSVGTERTRTQELTLTLKPRVDEVIVDAEGRRTARTRGVDVEGALDATEEQPALPESRPTDDAAQ